MHSSHVVVVVGGRDPEAGEPSQAELHVGAHSPLSGHLSVLRWHPRVSDENTSTYGGCHEDYRGAHQAAVGPADDR